MAMLWKMHSLPCYPNQHTVYIDGWLWKFTRPLQTTVKGSSGSAIQVADWRTPGLINSSSHSLQANTTYITSNTGTIRHWRTTAREEQTRTCNWPLMAQGWTNKPLPLQKWFNNEHICNHQAFPGQIQCRHFARQCSFNTHRTALQQKITLFSLCYARYLAGVVHMDNVRDMHVTTTSNHLNPRDPSHGASHLVKQCID